MNGAHHYEINLKQGDLFITLSSDDVYFISKQMEKWYTVMADDSYVPIVIPEAQPQAEPAPAPQPMPSPQPPPPAQHVQPVEEPPVEAPVEVASEPEPQSEDALDELAEMFEEEVAQAQPEPVLEQVVMEETVVMQEPEHQEPVYQEPAHEEVQTPIQDQTLEEAVANDDFDEVMDTLMKDLEDRPVGEGEPEPKPQPMPEPTAELDMGAPASPPEFSRSTQPQPEMRTQQPIMQEPDFGSDIASDFDSAMKQNMPQNDLPFDDMLDEALPQTPIDSPQLVNEHIEPAVLDLNTINSLAELCEQSRASSPEDFLILSSFFLTEIDGLDKFSLKKINSTLVQSGYTPVNHSVLEGAMTNQLIAMVPDTTGMADVSEYALTDAGQEKAEVLL